MPIAEKNIISGPTAIAIVPHEFCRNNTIHSCYVGFHREQKQIRYNEKFVIGNFMKSLTI